METIGGKGVMKKDYLRMAQWFMLSVVAYVVATLLFNIAVPGSPSGMYPRVQAILWKCGHLNMAAFMGYWIGRTRLGRLTPESSDLKHLSHAIVIGCALVAYGMSQ
jgi:hypothetical protein